MVKRQINLENPLIRELVVRKLTDEQIANRQVEFVISDESPDTYGTVFRLDGWDLERYEKNPIVLYGHRSNSDDPDNVIGTGHVYREGKQLIGRVTFEDEETNPKAEKVMRKVHNGTLRMASIGAWPSEGHWGDERTGEDPAILYFDRHELIEFSVVPIGSNENALKRSADSMAEIKKQFVRDINVDNPEQVDPNQNKTRAIRAAQLLINKSLK